MILTCKIVVPNNASELEIINAELAAGRDDSRWKRTYTKEERIAMTDYSNKCGTCTHFCPYPEGHVFAKYHGDCNAGHPWGQKSRPACKDYERSRSC